MLVRMNPGQRTDTPMPRGPSSLRSPSDNATTPYLLTLYGMLLDESVQASDGGRGHYVSASWLSIIGAKISMPQTTAIKFTPSVQFQPASFHAP